MNKLIFEECSVKGYKARTEWNIMQTDATLMIYVDGSTAGEKCTRNLCKDHCKPFFELNYSKLHANTHKVIDDLKEWRNDFEPLKLNVAGNGIYTWHKYNVFYNQDRVNDIVALILGTLYREYKEWPLIQSGAQSGSDEAAICWALQNNIPAKIIAPKGWAYRTIDNNDIYSEKEFKQRFGEYL